MTKGEETKAAILDQAVAIASEVGFTGLTIGQLAERTQMSKSGLFAHFKSKEVLQLETLQRARERFTDMVVRPALTTPRGVKRVQVLVERWLDWATDGLQGGCIFVASAAEYDDRPGPMRDAVVQNERDWLETIATVAGTAVAEGDFRADLDTEQFAFTVQGLMLSYHQAKRLLGDPKALEHVRQALDDLIAASAA
ncbi:MAG TPA: TetR/AcrR family transcriptional regulator [Nocardioides sp.]|jgi:AcrR family transcriptional regulator|nr:TetR/AcrR family transcriptional regulator [Nocardioides sp.]